MWYILSFCRNAFLYYQFRTVFSHQFYVFSYVICNWEKFLYSTAAVTML